MTSRSRDTMVAKLGLCVQRCDIVQTVHDFSLFDAVHELIEHGAVVQDVRLRCTDTASVSVRAHTLLDDDLQALARARHKRHVRHARPCSACTQSALPKCLWHMNPAVAHRKRGSVCQASISIIFSSLSSHPSRLGRHPSHTTCAPRTTHDISQTQPLSHNRKAARNWLQALSPCFGRVVACPPQFSGASVEGTMLCVWRLCSAWFGILKTSCLSRQIYLYLHIIPYPVHVLYPMRTHPIQYIIASSQPALHNTVQSIQYNINSQLY